MTINIYTIGFTETKASEFFGSLRREGVSKLVDVRLNNVSQLAGFAKKDDLAYFLRELCGIEYVHAKDLAPTKEMLDRYKKLKGAWDVYEVEFLELMRKRRIETIFQPSFFDGACLLCSEKKPHHCHRRLVAKYLQEHWNVEMNVKHLT